MTRADPCRSYCLLLRATEWFERETEPEPRSEPAAIQADSQLAFSLDEAAIRLGIGKSKLYQEINAGRLKAKKLGNRTLILATVAQAYLDALPDFVPAG